MVQDRAIVPMADQ